MLWLDGRLRLYADFTFLLYDAEMIIRIVYLNQETWKTKYIGIFDDLFEAVLLSKLCIHSSTG